MKIFQYFLDFYLIICENLGFHIFLYFLFCKSKICTEFQHLHAGIQLKSTIYGGFQFKKKKCAAFSEIHKCRLWISAELVIHFEG